MKNFKRKFNIWFFERGAVILLFAAILLALAFATMPARSSIGMSNPGAGTLQQVTDKGNVTTTAIQAATGTFNPSVISPLIWGGNNATDTINIFANTSVANPMIGNFASDSIYMGEYDRSGMYFFADTNIPEMGFLINSAATSPHIHFDSTSAYLGLYNAPLSIPVLGILMDSAENQFDFVYNGSLITVIDETGDIFASGTVTAATGTLGGLEITSTFLISDLNLFNASPLFSLYDSDSATPTRAIFTKTDTLNVFTFTNSVVQQSGIGAGIEANGSTAYGVTAASPGVATGAWSISAFIRFPASTGIIALQWADAGSTYEVSGVYLDKASGGGYIFYATGTATGTIQSIFTVTGGLNTGEWYHLVITHSAAHVVKAYVNTTSYSGGAPSIPQAYTPLASNTIYLSKHLYAPGPTPAVDWNDIRIFNTELTAGNVATLYNGGAGTTAALGGEVAWWGCNEAGSPLVDSIAANNFIATGGGDFTSVSGGGDIETATLIYSQDGAANGDKGLVYFGEDWGGTTLQGRSLTFETANTSIMTISEAGITSVATDTLKVGQFQAMTFATGSTITMQGGWATAEIGFATVTATYTYTFPTGLVSLNCITSVAYTDCYCVADSATDGRTSANCYLNDPAVADTRLYWQAWGR